MARLFGRAEQRRHELLSAYVDGEVSAEEAREVEDLLETSEEARRELAELQATVDLVRGLPELEPPRSFALDAAPEKRWTMWWPSVRMTGLATSVAAMLLVALVAGDMLDVLEQAQFGADESEYASDESAFGAAAAPVSAAQESEAVTAMDAPASTEPEAAPMQSADAEDEPVPALAAPAAAAPGMANVESSEESAVAMRQDMTEEAAQADAAESSEESAVAMRQDTTEEAAQADAAESNEGSAGAMRQDMTEKAPQAMAAQSNEESAVAMRRATTEGSEIIEGDAVVDYYEIDDREPEGITLPLVEFQVVTAIVVVMSVGATLVAVLRRRRSVP